MTGFADVEANPACAGMTTWAGASPPDSARPCSILTSPKFNVYTVYMKKLTTPEKILRAAHKLFDREGADAVSMRRVAEAVGITPMAIYRHFPNREALLKRLSDDSFNAVAHEWEVHATHPDVLKRLLALLEPYLDYALQHPHLFDHAFSTRRDDA